MRKPQYALGFVSMKEQWILARVLCKITNHVLNHLKVRFFLLGQDPIFKYLFYFSDRNDFFAMKEV